MGAGEMAQLRLPGAVVAGIFVDEDHRGARPDLFIIKSRPVGRRDVRHRASSLRSSIHLHTNEMLIGILVGRKGFWQGAMTSGQLAEPRRSRLCSIFNRARRRE